MPLKQIDLDKFLAGKLCFERDESRHIKFELPKKIRSMIPGVFPMHLQHGRGDVSDHIVRQVAGFLGLNQRRFLSAQSCHHSERVIFYSMLVSQLERLVRQVEGDPVVFSRNVTVYARCVPLLLENIDGLFDGTLHKRDKELLPELDTRLLQLKDGQVIARHPDRPTILIGIEALRKRIVSSEH